MGRSLGTRFHCNVKALGLRLLHKPVVAHQIVLFLWFIQVVSQQASSAISSSATDHIPATATSVPFNSGARGACDAGTATCATTCIGLNASKHRLCLLGSEHIVHQATCDGNGFVKISRPFADWAVFFGRDPAAGDIFRIEEKDESPATFEFSDNVWCGWKNLTYLMSTDCQGGIFAPIGKPDTELWYSPRPSNMRVKADLGSSTLWGVSTHSSDYNFFAGRALGSSATVSTMFVKFARVKGQLKDKLRPTQRARLSDATLPDYGVSALEWTENNGGTLLALVHGNSGGGLRLARISADLSNAASPNEFLSLALPGTPTIVSWHVGVSALGKDGKNMFVLADVAGGTSKLSLLQISNAAGPGSISTITHYPIHGNRIRFLSSLPDSEAENDLIFRANRAKVDFSAMESGKLKLSAINNATFDANIESIKDCENNLQQEIFSSAYTNTSKYRQTFGWAVEDALNPVGREQSVGVIIDREGQSWVAPLATSEQFYQTKKISSSVLPIRPIRKTASLRGDACNTIAWFNVGSCKSLDSTSVKIRYSNPGVFAGYPGINLLGHNNSVELVTGINWLKWDLPKELPSGEKFQLDFFWGGKNEPYNATTGPTLSLNNPIKSLPALSLSPKVNVTGTLSPSTGTYGKGANLQFHISFDAPLLASHSPQDMEDLILMRFDIASASRSVKWSDFDPSAGTLTFLFNVLEGDNTNSSGITSSGMFIKGGGTQSSIWLRRDSVLPGANVELLDVPKAFKFPSLEIDTHSPTIVSIHITGSTDVGKALIKHTGEVGAGEILNISISFDKPIEFKSLKESSRLNINSGPASRTGVFPAPSHQPSPHVISYRYTVEAGDNADRLSAPEGFQNTTLRRAGLVSGENLANLSGIAIHDWTPGLKIDTTSPVIDFVWISGIDASLAEGASLASGGAEIEIIRAGIGVRFNLTMNFSKPVSVLSNSTEATMTVQYVPGGTTRKAKLSTTPVDVLGNELVFTLDTFGYQVNKFRSVNGSYALTCALSSDKDMAAFTKKSLDCSDVKNHVLTGVASPNDKETIERTSFVFDFRQKHREDTKSSVLKLCYKLKNDTWLTPILNDTSVNQIDLEVIALEKINVLDSDADPHVIIAGAADPKEFTMEAAIHTTDISSIQLYFKPLSITCPSDKIVAAIKNDSTNQSIRFTLGGGESEGLELGSDYGGCKLQMYATLSEYLKDIGPFNKEYDIDVYGFAKDSLVGTTVVVAGVAEDIKIGNGFGLSTNDTVHWLRENDECKKDGQEFGVSLSGNLLTIERVFIAPSVEADTPDYFDRRLCYRFDGEEPLVLPEPSAAAPSHECTHVYPALVSAFLDGCEWLLTRC